jgi:Nucleotidyl transferase AbiEii toxin, Type IV TA system
MALPRTYSTAGAFRKALEERLKRISQADQIDLNRLRRHVSFDRLLARLFRAEAPPWVLKGGYALELRFKAARSTVDIDLTLQCVPATADGESASRTVREMLQSAADTPFGDWFEYKIGPRILDLDAAPYGGARYPVEARMDARIFAQFHLDAGIGDAVMRPLDVVECRDWLSFAGIKGCQVLMISREQQFAEKLHAYTLPRSTPNSRVKDLVDLALLTGSGDLNSQRLLDALRLTFERRATHPMPAELVAPPSDWQRPFQALAEECGLPTDLATVFARVREFIEKLVATRKEPSIEYE